VPPRPSFRAAGHREQIDDQRRERFRGHLPFGLHFRGAGFHEDLCIRGLVIIGRIRVGDENAGESELGKLTKLAAPAREITRSAAE
jgi:hypothetical protein